MAKKRFVLSNQRKNSYGFSLLTSGGDLTDFYKNPVMLFNHCEEEVIGKWIDIRIEGDAITAEPEFDMEDPQSAILANKVDKGYLNGASMGVQPLEAIMGFYSDEPELLVVTKWVAFEASITPIPSNGDALQLKLYNSDRKEMKFDELVKLSSQKAETINLKTTIMNKLLLTAIAVFKLAADTSEDAVVKIISEKGIELDRLNGENTSLKQEITVLKEAQKAQKTQMIDALISGAVASLKIDQTQAVNLKKLAEVDFETCKAHIESLPSKKSLSATIHNGVVVEIDKDKDKYADWDFKRLHREAPAELERIRTQEPERYAELKKQIQRS